MKTIITDIDDAVLGFTSAFVRYMAERGVIPVAPKQNSYTFDDLYGYDVGDAVIEFSESAGMGNLSPYANADEVIPYLRDLGYRFVGVTACHDTPEVRSMRANNIVDAFGFEFDEIVYVGYGGSKLEALTRMPPAIFIDDMPHHVRSGIQAGHQSILMQSGFLTDEVSDLTTVDSWHQIKDIALGIS